jgi:hypothetical protein
MTPIRSPKAMLGLIASPLFALLAWVSAVGTSGLSVCTSTLPLLPINDMALMYLLMSIFHASPWLMLFSHRSTEPRLTPNHNQGD